MKTFHHFHDHDFILGIFYFKDSLIESLDIILQTFSVFLVDYEEMGGIFLPNFMAHEIGYKEPA